ncbi:MAG TPA: hypothetical protein VNF74_04320 [Terriglobales bacterium]|nr:hypothetical protein [Terriglobales bacterium]
MQSGAAALEAAGFRATDVAALVPENHGTKDLAHEKRSNAAEGFMSGAIVGGIMGGGLGWLFASHVIGLATMEPLVDAGILVAMLAGVGALGVAGSVVGALVGLGGPKYEAVRYEGYRKSGGPAGVGPLRQSGMAEARQAGAAADRGGRGGCGAGSGSGF